MGVLGVAEIEERLGEIFAETGSPDRVRAAKYYLTLGEEFRVFRAGRVSTAARPRRAPFVLKPGETAFVTTAERLTMPRDLVGLLGPRFDNTERGVLFFGGNLVDPGYGWDEDGLPRGGEPLSFTIANVGASTFELRPGEDEIASLALLEVTHPPSPALLRGRFFNSRPTQTRGEMLGDSTSPPAGPLGLLEDVPELSERMNRIEVKVEQVVIFGVIVLAATLVAAVTTAILDLTGKVGELGSVEHGDPIWKSLGFTLGVAILGVVLVIMAFYCAAGTRAKIRARKEPRRLSS